jgi:type II secretory pathway pseudopilin PulG
MADSPAPLKTHPEAADVPQTMLVVSRIRERHGEQQSCSPVSARAHLRSERGFTLVETLIVASLMIVVLLAIASISDSTKTVANADQRRSDTLTFASAGLNRITADLRQACYLIAPATVAQTGTFCRTTQMTLAASASTGTRTTTPNGPTVNGTAESTACAPTATPATTPNNCLQFLMRGRTLVTRDATGTVTGTTRTLWRVRYNCAILDARDPLKTNTQCERFATQCTVSGAATTCLAPCSPSATGCTASGASTDSLVSGSVTNSAVIDNTLTPRPIFLYCTRATVLTCSPTFSTNAAAIRVDLAIARRGTLRSGLKNSIELKDAAELRNNVTDTSSRDDSASE